MYFCSLDYRLILICSSEKEEMSHFISKLHLYREYFKPLDADNEYRDYLASKFKCDVSENSLDMLASEVDVERLVAS